jgi:2-C-methyl-D-erythritol 4-phosphate cytidylyltransferase
VFVRWVLDAALVQQGDATDDLTLVEGLVARGDAKGRIVTVTGSLRGHKVTYPEDLALVRAIAEGRL